MTDNRHKLLHIFYNFDTGGAQKRLEYFINHTSDIFDHYITALNRDYSHLSSTNLSAINYPIEGYKKGQVVSNILVLRQHYKKLDPACILTQNFGTLEAIMANMFQKYPHIHNEDGFGSDEQITLKWRRNWLRKIFLIGKSLIVPSRTLERIANKHWKLFCDIYYIPNGVPEFKYSPECPFDNQGKLTIGTVAICRPEKNLGLFLETLMALKSQGRDIFGVIVGDGSELKSLKHQAQLLGLSDADILFAGYQENYHNFMAYFDIFVLTSHTEQQPLGVLDAMAAGLPVAATDVGDIKDMVSDANRPYIHKDIEQKLISLIDNVPQRAQAGQENRHKFLQEFQLDSSLEKRKQIILSVIN